MPSSPADLKSVVTARGSEVQAMLARVTQESSTPVPLPSATPKPPSIAMPESVPTTVVSDFGPSAKEVARRHAELLVSTLIRDLYGIDQRAFSAAEMQIAYSELCSEKNLSPRHWNAVAAAVAKLLKKRGQPAKTYKRHVDRHGRDRRSRVYVIPKELPS